MKFDCMKYIYIFSVSLEIYWYWWACGIPIDKVCMHTHTHTHTYIDSLKHRWLKLSLFIKVELLPFISMIIIMMINNKKYYYSYLYTQHKVHIVHLYINNRVVQREKFKFQFSLCRCEFSDSKKYGLSK